MTRSAIRSFQSKHGLAVDGIVGAQTEQALIANGAGNPPGFGLPTYTPTYPSVKPPSTSPSTSPGFITIKSGVILNPEIERVVRELDGYFRNAKLQVILTSAVRTPEEQLRIIKEKAIAYGLNQKYPSIETATVDNVESWLGAWDELRHRIGYEVLPPKYACSRIKPGVCKNPSPIPEVWHLTFPAPIWTRLQL
jgi:hypothetical protein